MSSHTINVIGLTKEERIDDKTSRRYECHAMNKMEMAQEKIRMERDGHPVVGWYAQTGAGCRMINADITYQEVKDESIKHLKLIECPICKGVGIKHFAPGFIKSCPVCNGSGMTKPGYWDRWQEWQLDEMKKSFE